MPNRTKTKNNTNTAFVEEDEYSEDNSFEDTYLNNNNEEDNESYQTDKLEYPSYSEMEYEDEDYMSQLFANNEDYYEDD